jgi:hypothetical protein
MSPTTHVDTAGRTNLRVTLLDQGWGVLDSSHAGTETRKESFLDADPFLLAQVLLLSREHGQDEKGDKGIGDGQAT